MERLTIQEIIDHCDRQLKREPVGSIFYREHEAVKAYLLELQQYRDTGLDPDEINGLKFKEESLEMSLRVACDTLDKFTKAEQEGRLVVFDEPMYPLVWGDKDHDTILCPRCLSDLMGGFQYAPSSEEKMYQCPHCGCPVDTTKVEDMVED